MSLYLFFSETGSHYVVQADFKFVVLLSEAPESEATMSACNFYFTGKEMDGGAQGKWLCQGCAVTRVPLAQDVSV